MALNLKEVDGVVIQPKHKATCHCGGVEFELDLPEGLIDVRHLHAPPEKIKSNAVRF